MTEQPFHGVTGPTADILSVMFPSRYDQHVTDWRRAVWLRQQHADYSRRSDAVAAAVEGLCRGYRQARMPK